MKNPLREKQILRLLSAETEMSVAGLANSLRVSEATMRRTLQDMEDRGLLRRIHGGATLVGISRSEPLFHDKQDLQSDAKEMIARTALDLIEDGDRIYLDGGSTLLALARLLDRRRNLVIVTNSLIAAAELMDTNHRLILVGGEFRSLSRTLVGPLTATMINSLHVDKAFMGTIGFSLEEGMTTTDPGEAYTKELMMHRANRVILLADSTKVGTSSFACSGKLTDIHVLITESASDEFRVQLERAGIKLMVAGREYLKSTQEEGTK